jgi:hypothetical protein
MIHKRNQALGVLIPQTLSAELQIIINEKPMMIKEKNIEPRKKPAPEVLQHGKCHPGKSSKEARRA